MYHGVDFSGAARPGEAIWLATGEPTEQGLRIEAVRPAAQISKSGERDAVLAALRRWIAQAEGAIGLDFSFGLPRAVLPQLDDWVGFIEWFVTTFADVDAEGMQDELKTRARSLDVDGVELKRRTDGPTGASSPYSFITRHQTLHGIRDVLAPLVRDDQIGVAPMAAGGCPTVCEVYPASTLRRLELPDERYKGGSHQGERARRERIVAGLEATGISMEQSVRETVLEDAGGDALDAVIGAAAVARAAPAGFPVDEDRYDPLEGYIFS